MFPLLESYLKEFRSCFRREATFKWFVVIIVGFMQRSDFLGITSVFRDLMLNGNLYECMRAFFYSTAWSLEDIRHRWYSIVKMSGLVYCVNGRTVLAGDGVKKAKEARYMPGVKKLMQESENSSKAKYIFGHLFGAVGVVLGKTRGLLCLPLKINIQDGIRAAAEWEGSEISSESHVLQMINNSFEVTKSFGKSIVLLDRYFLSVPALKRLVSLNEAYDKGEPVLEVVTKAKSNCVAYEKPSEADPHRPGRRRRKGKSIHLSDLWKNTNRFVTAKAFVYGGLHDVSYYSCDLLWGKTLYRELRFVLVVYDNTQSILVSTDLSLSPVEIIELYGLRQKIETCFREFNQQFGGFTYHFWTKSIEKLNHFKRKDEPDPLSKVSDKDDRRLILSKLKAIEGYVLLSTIAMGIVQMLSLHEELNGPVQGCRYLRTAPKNRVSEASIVYFMRNSFFALMLQHPNSFITRYILEKQISDFDEFEAA